MENHTMYKIAVLSGDGIGPEVMDAALDVLRVVGDKNKIKFELTKGLAGGCSIDEYGTPITDEVLEMCKNSDAVLLGAVGGSKWDGLPQKQKPEKGLLKVRETLELYSNLRPATIFPALADASALKREVVLGADIMVVRELTGGIYFGEPRGHNEKEAWNTLRYKYHEVERIAKTAFELAKTRGGHVTSVHKANVLESSQFWREVVENIHTNYPDITLDEMYVDNAAMQLVRDPKQFDVIVTQNMFGDILSDIAAMITGSLGMLPSASIGERHALYEPVHGTAPEIAGQEKANPLAMIGSVAMMFNISFGYPEAEKDINNSIEEILNKGYRTEDIASKESKIVSTGEMKDLIIEEIEKQMSFRQTKQIAI
ncbi:MAG: 3-isopropylmalate dehydrogenase [Candidatus Marinimicrobia bacterium]|jgi:3-isopropylmalate dehydrogenase|nr:3-isopropylmalate dehydrogenase [Candidatus Neomarinimicrobiota bacterium]|tara:strand:- start:5606 stop:6715 length:1110 start_codon:yes stop_codon:yes gene_type:complete